MIRGVSSTGQFFSKTAIVVLHIFLEPQQRELVSGRVLLQQLQARRVNAADASACFGASFRQP